jgi:hypothetical protein
VWGPENVPVESENRSGMRIGVSMPSEVDQLMVLVTEVGSEACKFGGRGMVHECINRA